MNRTIKTIYFHNGQLFAELGSRRVKLYDCKASVEIQEHAVSIPVIGRGKVINRRNVVLLITFQHAAEVEPDENLLFKISGLSFQGDVLMENGSYKQVCFNRCLLEDDLDITEGGSCRFEVQCSQELLNELRRM